MNKALVLALFLGLTTANTITGWTSPSDAAAGDRYTIANNDYMTMTSFTEFDMGYSSHYLGHAPDQLATGYQGESYGVNLYSYYLVNVDTEIYGYYKHNLRSYIEPIMVAPYTQTVYWSRAEA